MISKASFLTDPGYNSPISGKPVPEGGGKMILSYVRTVILYLVLILVIRLMGKRQIGEMEPAEFVVTMLVANLAAIPMQDSGIPLLSGLVPILTVLAVELVLSWLVLKCGLLRRFFCGKPILLIDNGKLLQGNLRMTRVTLDELTGKLREKDVLDISRVQYAILETDGNLSVFPYPKFSPASAKDAGIQAGDQYLPMVLVDDGKLIRQNLQKSGKSEQWVKDILDAHQAEVKTTMLLTVDAAGKHHWIGREETL